MTYLRSIDQHLLVRFWMGKIEKNSLKAFALYTRFRTQNLNNQQKDISIATEAASHFLNNGVSGFSFEALGWLLAALSGFEENEKINKAKNQIITHLKNNVNETAETANFITNYGSDEVGKISFLASDRRTDAIIMEALIETDPKNSLIPKLVKGLLAHKKKGRWGSTNENTYILLALDRYFHVFENIEPDFIAKSWVAGFYAGEQTFKGRTTDKQIIKVPMKYLAKSSSQSILSSSENENNNNNENSKTNIILLKQGQGRMYYRLGLTYAPCDLRLESSNYGFIVERTYEHIDKPEDVTFDESSRIWKIKASSRVKVRLTMKNRSRRYHVALVDKLPAGFEAINSALAGNASILDETNNNNNGNQEKFYYFTNWYEHSNIRDERVEAFTSLLWEGIHTFEFICRATTIGHFAVPPAQAEEMYSPEIFGRSESTEVIIY